MRRKLALSFSVLIGCLSVLAVLAGFGGVAAAAPAGVNASQVCAGTQTTEYDPGLMLTPRNNNVKAEGSLSCTDPARPTGVYEAHGHGQLSCVSGSSSGVATIEWSGAGGTSSFEWIAVVALRPGGNSVLVLIGTVSSGPYLNQMITIEIVLATATTPECLSEPGMQQSSGPMFVEII